MPADKDDFQRHLTTCLMLVAPVGMGEVERRDWLRVAWGTVRHLPADLLAIGAAEARRTADHPSKIVATIIGSTEAVLSARRAERAKVAGLLAQRERKPWEEDETPFDPATKPTPEQIAQIKAEYGIRSTEPKPKRAFDTPPRNSTREDYLALGVDAETLERLFPAATAAWEARHGHGGSREVDPQASGDGYSGDRA